MLGDTKPEKVALAQPERDADTLGVMLLLLLAHGETLTLRGALADGFALLDGVETLEAEVNGLELATPDAVTQLALTRLEDDGTGLGEALKEPVGEADVAALRDTLPLTDVDTAGDAVDKPLHDTDPDWEISPLREGDVVSECVALAERDTHELEDAVTEGKGERES